MKIIQNTLLGGALALVSFQAAALPFSGVDARSLAMGGTGTAAGSIVNASIFNPALLAASRDDEDFNLSLAFGVGARDENGLIDKVDDLQALNTSGFDFIGQFGADVDAYQAAITNSIDVNGSLTIAEVNADVVNEAAALTASAADLTTALNNLSNSPITVNGNFGFNVTIPGETLGISVFASSRVIASGYVTIDPADTGLITTTVDAFTNVSTFTELNALNVTDPFAGANLASSLTFNGGAVSEVGVAFATKILGIAIGVTPKRVQIDTIETTESLDTADTRNTLDNTGDSFSDANFDIGVAMDLGIFKVGAVGKNMISQEYALTNSVAGSTVIIEPQLRAGISFDAGWATLTMDQDLTENKGIISNSAIGDSLNSQYTAIGMEIDMSLVQIRAGLRSDNTGNSDDILSVGIGIHALATIDLAVAGNDQGADVILQLGMRW
ncbi:MAG: conjugal transfer protein TraF [Gammaproteobacteria bacterium]|nr:conjugal transfer protein TraF [Gammaproteobacteria bacterium]